MKLSLKALRVNANLTVKEVAEIVGVSVGTIYSWERSEESFNKATWSAVKKLAEAYGVSVDDLRA